MLSTTFYVIPHSTVDWGMCGSIDADAFAVTMQLTTTLRADAKMEEDEAENLEEELARELAALRDEDIEGDLSSLEDGK